MSFIFGFLEQPDAASYKVAFRCEQVSSRELIGQQNCELPKEFGLHGSCSSQPGKHSSSAFATMAVPIFAASSSLSTGLRSLAAFAIASGGGRLLSSTSSTTYLDLGHLQFSIAG